MSTEKQTIMQHKPFWDNGHFFRDISLILIFIQIYSEYQDVVAGFATMDYTMVILSMAIGEIPPFVFQMGWCFILLLMFIFTLGGTSRWPLTIQIFITMGMMVKYYLVLDYAWLVFLGFSFIVYCAAVREVRRREVRQYLSDILPGEGQTPLWQLLLAVIILNAAFTFPAYQKYTNKMQELNAEYQKDIEGFTQMKKVVENINQTASNISQGVIDSETYKCCNIMQIKCLQIMGDSHQSHIKICQA